MEHRASELATGRATIRREIQSEAERLLERREQMGAQVADLGDRAHHRVQPLGPRHATGGAR
jgi:hypothetical protein